MDNKLKTIIIMMSTYNGEKYLDAQLESIYYQSIPEKLQMKLIIRDDGSTDHTVEIAENWAKRMDIEIYQGSNMGARDSFFWLLKKAPRADYYAFSDQDDIWMPEKIQKAVEAINKGYHLYFSNLQYFSEENKLLDKRLLSDDFVFSFKRVWMCNPANGCTMVWDDKLQNYMRTVDHEYFTMHDEYICTVGLLFGKVFYDSEALVRYRIHEANVTQSKDFTKKVRLWKEIWFGRSDYRVDKRAERLLQHASNDFQKQVLKDLSDYRKGWNRWKLIRQYRCESRAITRSFKIRMLLKLL